MVYYIRILRYLLKFIDGEHLLILSLSINTVINLVIIIQQLLTSNRTLHLKAEAACRLPITGFA